MRTHTPSRRIATRAAAASAVFFGLLITLEGSAQEATPEETLDARGVAALVQSFYDQSTTFRASFRQRQYTKIYDRTEEANGEVVFEKPGKMRWDYAEPNGQVFVSDGETLTIYQPPDEGERGGQVIVRDLGEHQLPQAFSFLTGTGRLDRDFTFRLLDARRQRYRGQILELRPREPTPHYDRLLFYVQIVERNGQRAGVIQRVLIIDASGNRNRFDFSEMRFPRDVPDARFRYRAPAGATRVQP